MIYLYMRVSTGKQELDTQEHDLGKRYPTGLVFKETASGMGARPKLQQLIETVKGGDTVVVAALDRLGRRTSEILLLIETLHKRGVNVVSLREGMDYNTPGGRAFMSMMLVMAQLERDLISQRTKAALQAKKAAGVRLGALQKHPQEMIDLAFKLHAEGRSLRQIVPETGISRNRLSVIFQNAAKKAA